MALRQLPSAVSESADSRSDLPQAPKGRSSRQQGAQRLQLLHHRACRIGLPDRYSVKLSYMKAIEWPVRELPA